MFWYIIAGSAAIAIVIIATAVVVLGGSGSGGGGGVGGGGGGGGGAQTVDYVQYQLDVELSESFSLSGLDQQSNFGSTDDPLPSDCTGAAADVGQLQAHSRTWPAVLSAPMSQAEEAFSAAATDCSDGDFTTMQTDMSRGEGFLSATKDAFAAHCRPGQEVMRWQC